MSQPKEKLWELEAHTQAKHIILRNYLRAWFPIMGRYNERILFLDGFSGPGEYDNGEEGSPIIALKEAMNFLSYCEKHQWKKPEIVFFFIEQDTDRAHHLKSKIEQLHLPKQIVYEVINSTFEEVGNDISNSLEEDNAKLAPAFLFIDPFGYNLPFELIQKLMSHPKCEVFINFMYEFINRFITRDGQEKVMTRLFGTEDWRELNLDLLEPVARKATIHSFYQKQLEERAARYVRSFEMKGRRNPTKYFLFYGTNHKLGLEKMKDAMWSVDQGGGFTFSDATNPNQCVLFGNEPDYSYLKNLLISKFSGKQVTIESIEDYVVCETPFKRSHVKTNTLAPMEKANEIKVVKSKRKTKRGYPEGTIIQFL